jgi:hypothetical protein
LAEPSVDRWAVYWAEWTAVTMGCSWAVTSNAQSAARKVVLRVVLSAVLTEQRWVVWTVVR